MGSHVVNYEQSIYNCIKVMECVLLNIEHFLKFNLIHEIFIYLFRYLNLS